MRALRDSLGWRIAAVASIGLAGCGVESQEVAAPAGGADPIRAPAESYFPLAVGNEWVYRCSVEGEYLHGKTFKLTSVTRRAGADYFRGILTTSDSGEGLDLFYFADGNGDVYSNFEADRDGGELIVTAEPAPGDLVGDLIARPAETVLTPATGPVKAIRLESFDMDDPSLSEEQRIEWVGRFYVRGIGLVAEADGLGGECELTSYIVDPESSAE